MTAQQAAKTDRFHRAPRGGAISPVNGLFYLGGQFMPLASVRKVYTLARPAPLAGSVRQVAWAERLRREAIANLADEIQGRRLFLANPTIKGEVKAVRQTIREMTAAQWGLMRETSAAAIIERRSILA